MNGILLVNKPQGMTSHDVVNIVRRVYHTKKVGHTGTLDPDATGLLIVGINDGTKIMQYLNSDDKIYEARVCIGTATDTLDKTGEVIESKSVTTMLDVDSVLSQFLGEYTQKPPMYSAIKYNGKRLYEYARKGIEIEDRPIRSITIYSIERTSDVEYDDKIAYFRYRVHGSKGLYVRTLSYDIGQKLGYPAHNDALNRVQAGLFTIDQAYPIVAIKEAPQPLLSLSEALSFLPQYVANDELIAKIRHGIAVDIQNYPIDTPVCFVDDQHELLAIYAKHPEKELLKPLNVFMKDGLQ